MNESVSTAPNATLPRKQPQWRVWSRCRAAVSRIWRWEFWPTSVFYFPVLLWMLVLSMRYRSLMVWTLANPGLRYGGIMGPWKGLLLERLAGPGVLPTILVASQPVESRLSELRNAVDAQQWSWPCVLKPEASERGASVRRVYNWDDVEAYLATHPEPLLMQPCHPGMYEAGIFYYRMPGESRGHVLFVTDKVFPVITGDGQSTLEELIWRHPRFAMQAQTFLARHNARRHEILAQGETLTLAWAGNHCQGTLFRDGTSRLLTAELEQAVDEIVRRFDGVSIGRLDVRYSDVEEFRAGRDLGVVEMNGVMSEPTHIYDPARSLWAAYKTMFFVWALVFRIGAEHRRLGHKPESLWGLVELIRQDSRNRHPNRLSE